MKMFLLTKSPPNNQEQSWKEKPCNIKYHTAVNTLKIFEDMTKKYLESEIEILRPEWTNREIIKWIDWTQKDNRSKKFFKIELWITRCPRNEILKWRHTRFSENIKGKYQKYR